MKKVLILGGIESDKVPPTPYANLLNKTVRQYHFSEAKFEHLMITISPDEFEIIDGNTGKKLDEYDFVMIRGKFRKVLELAFVVSRYLALKGVPFLNDYSRYRPTSKLAQAVFFHELKLPFPATYFSMNSQYLSQLIAANLSYPIVVKDSFGAHGSQNYLVNSPKKMLSILKTNPEVKFVAQQFLPNDHDYRLLIIGNETPLQIKRTAVKGTHLNNTSQGGGSELVDSVPRHMVKAAHRLARLLQMQIAGVDVLQSKIDGKFYFLEINSQPQLVSGAFIKQKAEKIKNFLDSSLK